MAGGTFRGKCMKTRQQPPTVNDVAAKNGVLKRRNASKVAVCFTCLSPIVLIDLCSSILRSPH